MNKWHDAQKDFLPPVGKEVLVLVQRYKDDPEHLSVCFGHRVNTEDTIQFTLDGKIHDIHPQAFDEGGWNIPDVKWWTEFELPKNL